MNVAIWGEGKFGKYVLAQLKANDTVQINCFIDNGAGESKDTVNTVEGIPIVSPEVYIEKYATNTDLVLVAFAGGITILNQLKNLGIRKFGIISKRVYTFKLPLCDALEQDANIIYNDDEELKKVCTDMLETNVVDYCNMNCKGCSHFSNLFSKGSEIPYETFERDIEQLSKKVFVSQFNLLGGEVLLSNKVADYISCLKKYMPKTKVELVSNGLLIPYQKKEVFECIRDNDVTVSITEYPPTTTVLPQIKETLERYQILYTIRPLVETFGKNIDIEGKNDGYTAMLNCRESKCQFLREGRLYKCPFAALGNTFFEHYNIPICLHEGIDIYDSALEWEEEIRKLCNEPIDACKYCGKEERFSWKRSDCPLMGEWLI